MLAWTFLAIAGHAQCAPVGTTVEAFALPDFYGKTHGLEDYRDQCVVLAFLGTECPLAKHYAPRLRDLAAEFERNGVAFLGIDSNVQDSLSEMATFARLHGVTFPFLKDNDNIVADRLGAGRTPEVFLLDRQHVVRYWGRIDDQYGFKSGLGYAKPNKGEPFLATAIDEVLAGKEVTRPAVPPHGCLIGRVNKAAPHGEVTYSKDVARILQDRCLDCHRSGEAAPFPLTAYDEVVGWAGMIKEVVEQGRMPPWFADGRHGRFSNDARLNDEEKRRLCRWIENGCPKGDDRDLPEPRKFTEGWLLGTPDQVVYMSDEAFTVPATGTVDYQYYTVDPGWTTDKWIQCTEARPGNRAVVHHVQVYVEAQHVADVIPESIGFYAPGFIPSIYPQGTAMYVPAGARLRFQLHYTPNGTEQRDRSMIGIRFADPRSVEKMLHVKTAANRSFTIPAGDSNYEVKASYAFAADSLLLSLTPHMHLRGRSFLFEAEYPDGTSEVLLSVPNFEFGWQLRYMLAEPKRMPKGARLRCTAHFDNSSDNLGNPDPTTAVRYGEQSWEEMMEGNFSWIEPGTDVACKALVALSLTAGPVRGAPGAKADDEPK
jgi:peroxiredoxin